MAGMCSGRNFKFDISQVGLFQFCGKKFCKDLSCSWSIILQAQRMKISESIVMICVKKGG